MLLQILRATRKERQTVHAACYIKLCASTTSSNREKRCFAGGLHVALFDDGRQHRIGRHTSQLKKNLHKHWKVLDFFGLIRELQYKNFNVSRPPQGLDDRN
jgi:hypothetical protein